MPDCIIKIKPEPASFEVEVDTSQGIYRMDMISPPGAGECLGSLSLEGEPIDQDKWPDWADELCDWVMEHHEKLIN